MILFLILTTAAFVAQPAFWGALIAGALGLYGAHKDKQSINSANKANYAQLQQALGYLGWPGQGTFTNAAGETFPTAYGLLNQRFGQAEQYARQSGAALTRGAQQANRAIAMTGAGAQEQILRQGEQNYQRGLTGLQQAGLRNSSLQGQFARSNRMDTGRGLTQLAGQLAPVRAQGQLALGQAQAQGFNQLAGLSQNRAQMELQLALKRISLLAGVEHQPGPGFLSSIGGPAGLANFGAAIGGYDWGNLFGKSNGDNTGGYKPYYPKGY